MSREAIEEAIEVLEDASAEMLAETGDENYYDEAIAALRQALVDADDISQKRVDQMVKLEHDKQIEIAQAYERGWNAALAQQDPVECMCGICKLVKREWVGLTHPQIHELDWPDGVSFEDILLFVRAIEQALKEKNT